MLHKAAQFVADQLPAICPPPLRSCALLPGIGAYTAAAIASIAHGEPVAVVDGNVERVLCRLAGWEAAAAPARRALKRKIERPGRQLVDPERPGDFNQALMELGATVCLPRNPHCLVCPVAARLQDPRRAQDRAAAAACCSREVAHALSVRTGSMPRQANREVLLEQRPASLTVMPGLWELPTLRDSAVPEQDLRMTVRHAIMQVNYYVRIRTVFEDDVDAMTVPGGERRWVPLGEAAGMALTGLARKVLTRARLLPCRPARRHCPAAKRRTLKVAGGVPSSAPVLKMEIQ